MRNLSVKHIRDNIYTHDHDEVPEGTEFGFWRVVEHTGAGWFPYDAIYTTRRAADDAMARINRA